MRPESPNTAADFVPMFRSAYSELAKRAENLLAKETLVDLEPQELVHIAWYRIKTLPKQMMTELPSTAPERRFARFMCFYTKAMKRALIDEARTRHACKRGRDWKRSCLDEILCDRHLDEPVVDAQDLLDRCAEIVKHKEVFAGLRVLGSQRAVAERLGINPRKVSSLMQVIRDECAPAARCLTPLPMSRTSSGPSVLDD